MTALAPSLWTGRRLWPAGPGGPELERASTSRSVTTVADRCATRVSRALAVTAILVNLLLPGGWGEWAWLPLVVGLALGLPHGAVDHLLPARRHGGTLLRIAVTALIYAAVAALAYLAFRAAPPWGLALFIALSVWHFGTGETAFDDERSGRPVRTSPFSALIIGLLVLVVPLVRGSVTGLDRTGVRAVTAAVLGRPVPGIAVGWVGAVVLGLLVAATVLAILNWRGDRRPRAIDLALLAALATLTPPAVAFGVFFGCWHGLRHTARLISSDPRNRTDLAAGHLTRPMARFFTAAALPTVAVLAAVLLLARATSSWVTLTAAMLPVLAALTVPHTAVVTWLDRQPRPTAP